MAGDGSGTLGSSNWTSLLTAAKIGDQVALGQLLETCRTYLLTVAACDMSGRVPISGSPSDLVQDTFVDAQRGFKKFQGASPAELNGWLRKILRHNLADRTRRALRAGRRHAVRSIPLVTGDSHPALEAALADGCLTPRSEAIQREIRAQLDAALARLPPEYQMVLRLRHHQSLSFEEIGLRMGRTSNATHKLWVRALRRLRREYEGTDQASDNLDIQRNDP